MPKKLKKNSAEHGLEKGKSAYIPSRPCWPMLTHVSSLLCHFHLCSWSLKLPWKLLCILTAPESHQVFQFLATRMATKHTSIVPFKNLGVYLVWSKNKENKPKFTNLDPLTHPRRGHLDATSLRKHEQHQTLSISQTNSRNEWNPTHPRKKIESWVENVVFWRGNKSFETHRDPKKLLLPVPGEVER